MIESLDVMERQSMHELLVSHVPEEHWQELRPLEEEWFELLTRKAEDEHRTEKNLDQSSEFVPKVANKNEGIVAETAGQFSQSSAEFENSKSLSRKGSSSSLCCATSLFSPFTQRHGSSVTNSTHLSSQDFDANKTPAGKIQSEDSTPGHYVRKYSGVNGLNDTTNSLFTPPIGFNPNHLHMSNCLSTSTPQSIDCTALSSKNASYYPAGLEIDDSIASWTSSLVTPGPKHLVGDTSISSEKASRNSSRVKHSQGAARMLFSPDGKNTTQEFDIMAGLKELEASQEADDHCDSPSHDQHLSPKAQPSVITEDKPKIQCEEQGSLVTLNNDEQNNKESAPDPGGGGDTKNMLCSEDCFSQRLHDQALDEKNGDVQDLADGNERLELECDDDELQSALLDDEGREGVLLNDNEGHLDMNKGLNRIDVLVSSPLVVSDTNVSEEKITQGSTCIDGILLDLFGTPPSRNGVGRKPAPKRSKRRSEKHQVQNGAIETKMFVDKQDDEIGCSGSGEAAKCEAKSAVVKSEEDVNPKVLSFKAAIEDSDYCFASQSSDKIGPNLHDAGLENEDDLGFSQLSPNSVSALLQASDISSEHVTAKTSQKSKGNADSHRHDQKVSVSVNAITTTSVTCIGAAKTNTVLSTRVKSSDVLVSSSMNSRTVSSVAAVVSSVSMVSSSSLKSPNTGNASRHSAASDIARNVTDHAISSPMLQSSSSNFHGGLVSPAVRTPLVTGKPTSHKSSMVTPQNRPPCVSGSSKSFTLSRRHQKSFFYPSKKDIEGSSPLVVYNLEPMIVNNQTDNTTLEKCGATGIEVADATNNALNTPRTYNPYTRRRLHTSGFSTLANFNVSDVGRKNLQEAKCGHSRVLMQKEVGLPVENRTESKAPFNKTHLPKFTLTGNQNISVWSNDLNQKDNGSTATVRNTRQQVETVTSDLKDTSKVTSNVRSSHQVQVDSEVSFKLQKVSEGVPKTATTAKNLKITQSEGLKHLDNSTTNIPDDSFCDIDFEEIDKLSADDKKAQTDSECSKGNYVRIANAEVRGPSQCSVHDDFVVPDMDNKSSNIGFSTANGNNISVSDQALNAARKLVESEDQETVPDIAVQPRKPSDSSSAFVGFSTAKGNKLMISTKALNTARKLLESEDDRGTDILMAEPQNKISGDMPNASVSVRNQSSFSGDALEIDNIAAAKVPEERKQSLTMSSFAGFSTASGNSISITSKALLAAEKLLDVEEDHHVPEISKELVKAPNEPSVFPDLSATDGVNTGVSSKACNATQKLHTNESLDGSERNPSTGDRLGHSFPTEKGSTRTESGFIGFSTAKGSKITISKKALCAARKMLESEDEKDDLTKDTQPSGKSGSSELSKDKAFNGFMTAGGSSLPVSSKSLIAARKLLEAEECIDSASNDSKDLPHSADASAAKETIPGSEKSIQNIVGRSMVSGQSSSDEVKDPESETTASPSKFKGFATASGKGVSVSKKALNAARKMMDPDDNDSAGSAEIVTQPSKFAGFSTAGGNRVPISSSALQTARKLLEDDDAVTSSLRNSEDNSSSRASLSVSSEDGLKAKTEEMLIDLSKENETSDVDIPKNLENKRTDWQPRINHPPGSCNFPGFSTAGGKTVAVSKKALDAAKSLLESEDVAAGVAESKEAVTGAPAFDGFSTAGGKSVAVSSNALNAARKFLEADEQDKSSHWTGKSDGEPLHSSGFKGFTTAKGSIVPISSKALDQARKLLESDDKENVVNQVPEFEKESPPGCGFSGFSTGGGKSISISDKALCDATKLMESDDNQKVPVVEHSTIEVQYKSSNTAGFTGFTTARGNHVAISSEALKNAKKLLETDGANTGAKSEMELSDNCDFAGFTTASGSNISVSSKALTKANKLLDSDDTEGAPTASAKIIKDPAGFTGFTPAKGNRVSVCNRALSEARSLLESDDNEALIDGTKQLKKSLEMAGFSAFTTAKGNSVPVSSKALHDARKLLEDETETSAVNNATESIESSVTETSGFAGFSTASGKNVAVSGKSLDAARKMLDTEKESTYTEKDSTLITTETVGNPAKSGFTGFSTARGKDVSISSEALNAAKKLLDSDDGVADMADNTGSSGFAGFATAAGNTVQVSSKALSSARKVLESTDRSKVSDEMTELTKSSITSGFVGFSTAKGNAVAFSKEAINAARQLLDSEENHGVVGQDFITVKPTASSASCEEPGLKTSSASKNRKNLEFQGAKYEATSLKSEQFSVKLPSTSSKTAPYEILLKSGQANFGKDAASEKAKLELEAEESMKAFLEDDDWDLDACQAVMVATTTSQKLEGKEPARPWMKAKYSSPEDFCDQKASGTTIGQPVKSGPEEEAKKSTVTGPNLSESHIKLSCADRPGFEQKPQLVKRINNFYKLKLTEGVHSVALNAMKPSAKFSTPVKTLSGFKTPVKDTKPPESTFRPPVKKPSAESSFTPPVKTPISPVNQPSVVGQGVKRSHSSSHCDSPAKLAKLEEDDSDVKDEKVLDKSPEDAKDVKSTTKNVQVSDEVKKNRAKARLAQAKRIKEKREGGKVKPFPGTIFQIKQGLKKLRLQEYVMNTLPRRHTQQQVHMFGVPGNITNVSISNAEDFRFNMRDFLPSSSVDSVDTILLGDGASVVLDEISSIGKEEICNGFLDMEGVDPNLISRDWVYNHYKWIVWKCAALEVCFPHCFGARCLTPDRLILQLKLRYDREIDNSQRSCLKKIFEQDDTPARPMVLCVSGIQRNKASSSAQETKESSLTLQLTDGWYSIPVQLDSALIRLVNDGRISIGDKLFICSAEMLGHPEPSPPLQATEDTVLKIFCNSTRKARWDAKIGFSFIKMPMAVPLTSLYPDGGIISCLEVIVTRIYPLQFMEKNSSGGVTFRNERSESRAAQAFDKDKEKHMEVVYAKLQNDFEDRISKIDGSNQRPRRSGKRLTSDELRSLQTGQEIYEALQAAVDPADLEASLGNHQMALLCDYRRHLQDQLQAEMAAEFQKCLSDKSKTPTRNVTSLLKIRLAGLSNSDIDNRSNVLLTIWQPTEDLRQMFAEGKAFRIRNLLASENRGKGSSAVSLTASRSTCYAEINVSENVSDIVYEPREVTSAADMMVRFNPAYSEVDVVGFVVQVSASSTFDRPSGSEGQVQLVYLADSSNQLYAVKFWGGIKAYGLEETMKTKACIGCGNLQWRGEFQGKIPTLTASELSTFTSSPKAGHLKSSLNKLITVAQDKEAFVKRMYEKLNEIWSPSTPSMATGTSNLRPAVVTPSDRTPVTSASTSLSLKTTPASKNEGFMADPSSTPTSLLHPPKVETVSPDDDKNVDPVVAKKILIQKQKAQRLAQYGSPPKISALSSPANPVAYKAFKPPSLRTPKPDLSTSKRDTPANSTLTPAVTSSFKTPLNFEVTDSSASSSYICKGASVISTATPKTSLTTPQITPKGMSSECKIQTSTCNVTRTRGRKSLGSRRSLSWRKPDPQQSENVKEDFSRKDENIPVNLEGTNDGEVICDKSHVIDKKGCSSDELSQCEDIAGQPLTCSGQESEKNLMNIEENSVVNCSQQSNCSEISIDNEMIGPEKLSQVNTKRGSKLSKGRKRKLNL